MLIGSYRVASDKGAELRSHSTTVDEDEGFQLKTARESFPRLLAQRKIKMGMMMMKIKKNERRKAGSATRPDLTFCPEKWWVVAARWPARGTAALLVELKLEEQQLAAVSICQQLLEKLISRLAIIGQSTVFTFFPSDVLLLP